MSVLRKATNNNGRKERWNWHWRICKLQVTQVLVLYHRDDLEAVRICCLYCRLRPCIQNLRRGVSSSLAPITCISFLVSSAVLLPPALVNLNLTFTLLQWQRKEGKLYETKSFIPWIESYFTKKIVFLS